MVSDVEVVGRTGTVLGLGLVLDEQVRCMVAWWRREREVEIDREMMMWKLLDEQVRCTVEKRDRGRDR